MLSKESAHTKADYIPYEGISVTGKVRDVILRGHHMVQDGSLTESYLGECIHNEREGLYMYRFQVNGTNMRVQEDQRLIDFLRADLKVDGH